MTNNDVLRRIRYTFDFDDSKMIAIFGLADLTVTRAQISDWLKKEDDPAYLPCEDAEFAAFLNGLIIDKRGKKEGAQPAAEKRLTNNLIFLLEFVYLTKWKNSTEPTWKKESNFATGFCISDWND